MARDEPSPAVADLVDRLTSRITDPNDLQQVLNQLMAAGRVAADPGEQQPPPSRRRPRRADTVTYRVRIDVVGAKPPLWRRLELASDMFLDELHDLVQVAFGWTDSHLHRFGSGQDFFSIDTENYLCPFDVDEGEVGAPEEQVRLDEVLVEGGDVLFYIYDFGDDWRHRIKLEAVLPREGSARRAVCTAGRRDGPAEDCGGIGGYELVTAATDPTHDDHADAVAEYARCFGDDADPAVMLPTRFDIDEINEALADVVTGDAPEGTELPKPLTELVAGVRTTPEQRELRRLAAIAVDGTVQVDADIAARMVRPYTWLLDHVGADGITLTGAGYLPPAHVEATVAALDLGKEWIGKGNRENQTLPVLHLRESAQKAGLLRKHRGKLLRTARGRAIAHDPTALWWQLAERMPVRSTDASENQAGLLFLVAVAADAPGRPEETVARFLDAIGWVTGDDGPITGSSAYFAAWDTATVLRRIGALPRSRAQDCSATPEAITFARAALRAWPDG